jgi:1-acyl-sn-glycerol-3-phosphate acyltransferase
MPDTLLTTDKVSSRRRRFALRLLTLFGWRVRHAPLPGPRGIVIVYPHTSNWDTPLGLLAKWALDLRFRWVAKDTLFRGLIGQTLGRLLRACGGEPIERHVQTGAIERLAQRIRQADWYWLVLTPEGTRSYRDHWRSGFYHIALAANVPVGLGYIDYGSREIGLVEYLTLSGNVEVDLKRIADVYRGRRGLRPEQAAPIAFGDPQKRK